MKGRTRSSESTLHSASTRPWGYPSNPQATSTHDMLNAQNCSHKYKQDKEPNGFETHANTFIWRHAHDLISQSGKQAALNSFATWQRNSVQSEHVTNSAPCHVFASATHASTTKRLSCDHACIQAVSGSSSLTPKCRPRRHCARLQDTHVRRHV
jgi:hypothetical protein